MTHRQNGENASKEHYEEFALKKSSFKKKMMIATREAKRYSDKKGARRRFIQGWINWVCFERDQA